MQCWCIGGGGWPISVVLLVILSVGTYTPYSLAFTSYILVAGSYSNKRRSFQVAIGYVSTCEWVKENTT